MTCSEGEETTVRWLGSMYCRWFIGLGINVFPVARPGDESFGPVNPIDGMSANVFSIFGWGSFDFDLLLRAVLQATSLPGQPISMTETKGSKVRLLIDVTATTTNPLPTHHILPLYQKTKLTPDI